MDSQRASAALTSSSKLPGGARPAEPGCVPGVGSLSGAAGVWGPGSLAPDAAGIAEDACATRDLKFGDKTVKAQDVHTSTLATFIDGGYAKVITVEAFKAGQDKVLFQNW